MFSLFLRGTINELKSQTNVSTLRTELETEQVQVLGGAEVM